MSRQHEPLPGEPGIWCDTSRACVCGHHRAWYDPLYICSCGSTKASFQWNMILVFSCFLECNEPSSTCEYLFEFQFLLCFESILKCGKHDGHIMKFITGNNVTLHWAGQHQLLILKPLGLLSQLCRKACELRMPFSAILPLTRIVPACQNYSLFQPSFICVEYFPKFVVKKMFVSLSMLDCRLSRLQPEVLGNECVNKTFKRQLTYTRDITRRYSLFFWNIK